MAYTKQITVMTNDPGLDQITAMIEGNTSLAANGSYLEVLRFMQLGEWQQAIPLIQLLKAQYPRARELELLLSEVKLRAEYDANWDGKIKARRTTLNLPRLASRVVPISLIALFVVAAAIYIGQSRQVSALSQAREALFSQAQQAILDGDFQGAFDLYAELLEDDPEDASALTGRQEAERMMALNADYNEILTQIDAGKFQSALSSLMALQEDSPGFRDVPALIEQLTTISDVEQAYAKAEESYTGSDWKSAAKYYELVRQIDSTYRPEEVTANLVDSYVNLGRSIVTQDPTLGADLDEAQTNFQKALKLELGQPKAKLESEILDAYLEGDKRLASGNLSSGVEDLLPVYQSRPDYLDGYLALSLYNAYVQLGQDAEADGDLRRAMGYYGKAAALTVKDRSVALGHLREVAIALTPTATPTVPPTATIAPTPYPTATPVPLTMADLRGWILFRSNRDGGSALFVMRPDGTDVQLAPTQSMDVYNELYDGEKWSPDGNNRLYVKKQKRDDGARHNIYKERADLPANWKRDFRLTDMDGTSYDPVWSPNNSQIAFVSNVSGGDEIWVMHPEGQDHVRLTWNGWEWDKHPTWSPDGSQILFWSNRTGLRQLWIMGADGSNQRALTTEYENWDPIWLK